MHNDAVEMGRLLQNLSRNQRTSLIDHVKSGSRVYISPTSGKRTYRSSRNVYFREIEELLVPTIRAGRVLTDRPDFVASMRQLDFSPEKILEVIAGYASDPALRLSAIRRMFALSIASSFILAVVLGFGIFYVV